MKSIKSGRGPSAMGGIGSAVGVLFGIVWTLAAAQMGAPFFFVLFGILFVLMGAAQAVYHFRNASGENRYSEFDIVDSEDEPDPFDPRSRSSSEQPEEPRTAARSRFCPYCGAKADGDFEFCNQCGKKLP